MPGLRTFVGAWLVLALCAAPLSGALAAIREPVTGGIVSLPAAEASPTAMSEEPVPASTPATSPADAVAQALEPAPAPASGRQQDDTAWGVLLRGGYFGLPDPIADKYFSQHPKIEGTMFGAELRYHGEGGGRGGSSIGFAVDSGSAKTDGLWQRGDNDAPQAASGEIELLAFTVTGYWVLFPSWYVHPYFGLGLGLAHLKGSYQKETDLTDLDAWIPAVHVPVGLAVELGPRYQLAAEARFIDGIAAGASLQVRF